MKHVTALLLGLHGAVLALPTNLAFTDVTAEAGIDHLHSHAPGHGMHQDYAWLTGGAVAEDFNGDGWIDLYVLQGGESGNLLYMNRGDGTFSEEAGPRGAGLQGNHMGVAAADFDNDGDVDIAVSSHLPPHYLMVNDGAGFFALDDQSVDRPYLRATSPGWVDLDNDGDLELALGSWVSGVDGFIQVFDNAGAGQLVTGQQLPHEWTFVPRFADLNGDRCQDLLAVADFGRAGTYLNQGNGLLLPNGTSDIENGMGTSVGDVDGDGRLDWFMTAIRDHDGPEANWGTSGNRMLMGSGDGSFVDATTSSGLRDGSWGWGCAMADFDNDGDLDIYHVTGWPDTAHGAADEFAIVTARLFDNQGGGVFVEVAAAAGDAADTGQGRCVVAFDYDNDGDQDLFVANNSTMTEAGGVYTRSPGVPVLLRNDSWSNTGWLKVRLAGGPGHHSHGIGAKVVLTHGGVSQVRELHASSGFNGHGPERIAHFGLHVATPNVDEVWAEWPNGDTTVYYQVATMNEAVLPSPVATLSARSIAPGETVHAGVDPARLPPGATVEWSLGDATLPNPAVFTLVAPGEHNLRMQVFSGDPSPRLLWSEVLSVTVEAASSGSRSIARLWNEQNLAAIRIDVPDPTVHARNLFHTSVAMWDAWAAYDSVALGYLHNEPAIADDIAAARGEAVSYAAYRILTDRYQESVNASTTLISLGILMDQLGYDPAVTTTLGPGPAALGNRVAQSVLSFTSGDGATDPLGFLGAEYEPLNAPMPVAGSGAVLAAPNHWQPLLFEEAETQNGLPADVIQKFLGFHWGGVRPFALMPTDGSDLYYDPGIPPQLGGLGDEAFKQGNLEVIRRSGLLDPSGSERIDISPGAIGNNSLGGNDGPGHAANPVTGQPYLPNLVLHADYGRAIAEFWADGPHSETPPGHWNVLANEVADHPLFERRFAGGGDELERLEWDVKTYFVLNAALHDAAIVAWGCKRVYDYVRPVSSIRHMGGLGQSSDPTGPSFHPSGLPLSDGLVEVVTAASSGPGERHEHLAAELGKITIHAWQGQVDNPSLDTAGVGWILAEDWLPYQRDTFVTPAFAGYISGHSTFSRAAAEVLARLTGSPFFPGGLASFTVPQGSLEFENGPASDLVLEWASYGDAADQAGISRIYGGIHVPADDGPGRIAGARCGIAAWDLASKYFDGSIRELPFQARILRHNDGSWHLQWDALRGFFYRVVSSDALDDFGPVSPWVQAGESTGEHILAEPPASSTPRFFKVVRTHTTP